VEDDAATIHVLAPEQLPPVEELERTVRDLVPWHPDVVIVHTVGSRITQ
jgi:NifB/MoaA-like Fe-S oxidoreductase